MSVWAGVHVVFPFDSKGQGEVRVVKQQHLTFPLIDSS